MRKIQQKPSGSSRGGLKQRATQRQAEAKTLHKMADNRRRLMVEARRLQKKLQTQTHRIIAAQEEERGKLSRQLRDEVAQILLGINVRLLALKKKAPINVQRLKMEIAGTQRLVEDSVQTINRSLGKFAPNRQRKTHSRR